MDRKIRIAHFGVGRMGSIIIRYITEKGGELVAALDHNAARIGRDAGEVAGIGPLNVIIHAPEEAPAVLSETRPDICVLSTKGTLAEMKEIITVCAEAGCNVITIGENAAWPWTTEPELAAELDSLAKRCGVTVSASGYPDIYWQTLVLTLAGSHEKLTRIHGTVTYNVEQYGPHFITGHGVGLSLEEFRDRFTEENSPAGYGQNCMPGDPNGWLCHALGLTVISQVMRNVPRLSKEPVWCESYGRDILPGEVLGTANLVTTETKEGILLELEVCGKIYKPGEKDALTWEFEGEPNTTITVTEPDTPAFTAASPVNRIPQILSAAPGYITTDQLPPAGYLVRPMNEYVV